MKTTKVKCICGTEYDACLDNDYNTIECPKCKSQNYQIIDPNYQGPWKIGSECERIWKEKIAARSSAGRAHG